MLDNKELEVILELKHITKRFPGVVALDNIDFRVYRGKVMGLVGENGAGKSTLMKIITGIYQKDQGKVFYQNQEVDFKDTKDSMKAGIAIIHQELNLLLELSIMENIFLGREPLTKFGTIDFKKMYAETLLLFQKLAVDYNPKQKVAELSIGAQQMVEIAKVLSQNAKLIIMDEPTDALTTKESEKLFQIIEELTKENKSIVYISHRLNEIFEVCEHVSVFRDGKFICENETKKINKKILIEQMVGRTLAEQFPYERVPLGKVVLQAKNLTSQYIHDISFSLHQGEVLGISGLIGSARTELCKTIAGALPYQSGNILMNDIPIKMSSVQVALQNNIVYVSEDRKKDGLVLEMNVRENATLASLSQFENLLFYVHKKREQEKVQYYIEKFQVKTTSLEQQIRNLSGGNQQKVSITKALLTHPQVLILDEPTRGIDIGAKRDIYLLIQELKKQGIAILLVSSEMPEIVGLSDRVLVMLDGKINGEFSREEVTQEKLLQAAVHSASI